MSWITIVWSMASAACATLALIHLVIWFERRSQVAHLLFALTVLGAAGNAIAELGMLASSFTSLLLPSYRHLVDQFAMVLTIGELPIVFWLLIWGAKDQPLDEQPPDPALA